MECERTGYSTSNATSNQSWRIIVSIGLKEGWNFQLFENEQINSDSTGWLSYKYLDIFAQSEKFLLSEYPRFKPLSNSCQVVDQNVLTRDDNIFRIYVCSEGLMLGCGSLDLSVIFNHQVEYSEYSRNVETAEGFLPIIVTDPNCNPLEKLLTKKCNDMPCISMDISLFRVNEVSIHEKPSESTVFSSQKNTESLRMIDPPDLCTKVLQAKNEIEKEKREWKKIRHQEEITFQEKSLNKDKTVKCLLDNQASNNDRKMNKIIDTNKKQENRLKRALMEVERRNHQLEAWFEIEKNNYSKTIAELELKGKKLQQECEHMIDTEVKIIIGIFHL